WPAKVQWIDRSRLRPTQGWNMAEHGDEWHQNGSDRINVLDRIQCDSPKHARGRVAAQVCHPRVGRFMDADGEQERYKLKDFFDEFEAHSLSAAKAGLIVTCGAIEPTQTRAPAPTPP